MTDQTPFRKRRPGQAGPPSSPNELKGWLVETTTAWLHEFPFLRVEHDVLLRSQDGATERQVDVLLLPAGVDEREKYIVIECKNYGEPVDMELIDAFVGKMNHLGLPLSQGYYVQVKEYADPSNPRATMAGFTQPAKERARAAGIKLLELSGIDSVDRLKAEVYVALQSVIFLLADFADVNLAGGPAEPITEVQDVMQVYDPSGTPSAVPHYVWEAWMTGSIPSEIHTNYLTLEFPPDWYFVLNGEKYPAENVGAKVEVNAYVQTFEGQGRHHELVDAQDSSLHKFGAEVQFEQRRGKYELKTFTSEAELAEHITSAGVVHVFQRIKAPRIRFWEVMYWPPSARVCRTLQEGMEAFLKGEGPDPRPFDFTDLEGRDISVAWEPASPDYFLSEHTADPPPAKPASDEKATEQSGNL